jgi:hypothetical protein
VRLIADFADRAVNHASRRTAAIAKPQQRPARAQQVRLACRQPPLVAAGSQQRGGRRLATGRQQRHAADAAVVFSTRS